MAQKPKAKRAALPAFKAHYGKQLPSPVGRLVFPSIHEPKPGLNNSKPKYSASIVCDPNDATTIRLLEEIDAVGIKTFGQEAWENSEVLYHPYTYGEEIVEKLAGREPPISEQTLSMYRGKIRITAKGSGDKAPPECLLKDLSKLPRRPGNMDDTKHIQDQYYAGCYARLGITPFSFKGSDLIQGVGLILKGIQFIQDGDKLGSEAIEDTFADEPVFTVDEGPTPFDEASDNSSSDEEVVEGNFV